MRHHFTVDVEEYFHPTPLEPWVPAERWPNLERRAEPMVDRLLAMLDDRGVKATFFVLGWLAEREPQIVQSIHEQGHEVASHGWTHRLTTLLTTSEFRNEIRRSKELLEDISGEAVVGFRAPSFSIVPGVEWALDVLVEEGYEYDSSLFPVRVHPTYGYPCDRDPHLITCGSGRILEFPPSTLRLLGANLPAAGGAYLRFLPYHLIRSALRHAELRRAPGTFYTHPWELDPHLPDLGIPWRVRMRVGGRVADVASRIKLLLGEFDFQRMDVAAKNILLASELSDPPAQAQNESEVKKV